MSEIVIDVEHISKLYRLGQFGTGTLSHDLNRWWARFRGKDDPYQKINEVKNVININKAEYVWALKDVSFKVSKGEIIGIIGSNGAGKSTLLKILSQITTPSKGVIKIKGKIASLLEVGTGFHPELTGKENIFLNGAILGMTKKEIRLKFDEIVAFAGVENYIDTPVKRYSSGMYVRLAFAVAAHLEPDILVIDEVLAVGDAEFQKKCLGKMKEVSTDDGRTILFVSHNMQAINSLCSKAIWLQHGQIQLSGEVSGVVSKYISGVQKLQLKQEWNQAEEAPGNNYIRFKKIELIPHVSEWDEPLDIRKALTVKFEFWNFLDDVNLSTGLVLYNYDGTCIFDLLSPKSNCKKGIIEGECSIPGNFLNDGSYYFSINVVKDTSIPLFNLEECLSFEIEDYREDMLYFEKWWGAVRPKFPFLLKQKEFVKL